MMMIGDHDDQPDRSGRQTKNGRSMSQANANKFARSGPDPAGSLSGKFGAREVKRLDSPFLCSDCWRLQEIHPLACTSKFVLRALHRSWHAAAIAAISATVVVPDSQWSGAHEQVGRLIIAALLGTAGMTPGVQVGTI